MLDSSEESDDDAMRVMIAWGPGHMRDTIRSLILSFVPTSTCNALRTRSAAVVERQALIC